MPWQRAVLLKRTSQSYQFLLPICLFPPAYRRVLLGMSEVKSLPNILVAIDPLFRSLPNPFLSPLILFASRASCSTRFQRFMTCHVKKNVLLSILKEPPPSPTGCFRALVACDSATAPRSVYSLPARVCKPQLRPPSPSPEAGGAPAFHSSRQGAPLLADVSSCPSLCLPKGRSTLRVQSPARHRLHLRQKWAHRGGMRWPRVHLPLRHSPSDDIQQFFGFFFCLILSGRDFRELQRCS